MGLRRLTDAQTNRQSSSHITRLASRQTNKLVNIQTDSPLKPRKQE